MKLTHRRTTLFLPARLAGENRAGNYQCLRFAFKGQTCTLCAVVAVIEGKPVMLSGPEHDKGGIADAFLVDIEKEMLGPRGKKAGIWAARVHAHAQTVRFSAPGGQQDQDTYSRWYSYKMGLPGGMGLLGGGA